MGPSSPVTIAVASPTSTDAGVALWRYSEETTSRYYRRAATTREVHEVVMARTPEDLDPPRGLFLLATQGTTVVGCAGARWHPDDPGEDAGGGTALVEPLFVIPSARGRGVGRQLLARIEQEARVHGVHRLRLHTRAELVEVRRLLARLGYHDTDPAPDGQDGSYAEHWYTKTLHRTSHLAPG